MKTRNRKLRCCRRMAGTFAKGICASIAGAFAVLCQTPPSGAISGVVQTTDGKPIASAIVAIMARPSQFAGSSLAFNTAVLTASDGTFQVTAVPNGTYAVCPYLPKSSLAAPCRWGSEPSVTIDKGQQISMQPVQLPAGADLYIRVNDPSGTRAATEGKVPGASLLLTARSLQGNPIPIPMTASDQQGFDHHLTVPFGTDLVFTAYSSSYTMTNQAGAAISRTSGLIQTINIPAAQAQFKQVINIH